MVKESWRKQFEMNWKGLQYKMMEQMRASEILFGFYADEKNEIYSVIWYTIYTSKESK